MAYFVPAIRITNAEIYQRGLQWTLTTNLPHYLKTLIVYRVWTVVVQDPVNLLLPLVGQQFFRNLLLSIFKDLLLISLKSFSVNKVSGVDIVWVQHNIFFVQSWL